jgi:hypothetical protein
MVVDLAADLTALRAKKTEGRLRKLASHLNTPKPRAYPQR